MIIFEDRKKLSIILQQYLDSEIDSFTLEDTLFPSADMLVRELSYEVELQFNEAKSSFCNNHITQELFERFLLLLDSNFEFPINHSPHVLAEGNWIIRLCKIIYFLVINNFHVVSSLDSNPFWPFSSMDDWAVFQKQRKCIFSTPLETDCNCLATLVDANMPHGCTCSACFQGVDQTPENQELEEGKEQKPDDRSCLRK